MASTSKPAPSTTTSVKLSQQSVNVLRQIVAAVGWAKSYQDIYVGGQLLSETHGLPTLDSTDWVKTPDEVKAMKPAARAAYLKTDQEWGAKVVAFSVTETQGTVIKKAFDHFMTELVKVQKLGPSAQLNEIIDGFKWEVTDAPIVVPEAKA